MVIINATNVIALLLFKFIFTFLSFVFLHQIIVLLCSDFHILCRRVLLIFWIHFILYFWTCKVQTVKIRNVLFLFSIFSFAVMIYYLIIYLIHFSSNKLKLQHLFANVLSGLSWTNLYNFLALCNNISSLIHFNSFWSNFQ